jgi:hypothetical protein
LEAFGRRPAALPPTSRPAGIRNPSHDSTKRVSGTQHGLGLAAHAIIGFPAVGSVACCGMREGISIEVSAADRDRLERIVADRNSPQKHVWRARIILATAQGCGTAEIMRRAKVSKPCVWRWQERFMREGVAGLVRDKTRKPGLPPLPPAVVDRVVALTLTDPPGETTHWTGRAIAAASGVSLRSVQRIWAPHGLQPHRVRRFKLIRRSQPSCAMWSASISIRRRTASCSRSTRNPMCGWPPARKRKVNMWHNAVASRSCVRPHMRASWSSSVSGTCSGGLPRWNSRSAGLPCKPHIRQGF